jgi:hypothetical protein
LADAMDVPETLLQARDQEVVLIEGVDPCGLVQLAGEDGELDAELLVELVLPLLDQAAGGDEQYPLGVGAHPQLADEESGHDGLACPGDRPPERTAGAGAGARTRRPR